MSKIVAAIFAMLLVVSFVFWGVEGIVNYSASFVSFLLIAAASFVGYKKVVSSASAKQEDVALENEDDDEEDQKESKMTILTKTYKGLLFPFRLGAYAVFVLVFLYFSNNNLLNVFAFLLGIAVLPISALIFIFFFRRSFVENA